MNIEYIAIKFGEALAYWAICVTGTFVFAGIVGGIFTVIEKTIVIPMKKMVNELLWDVDAAINQGLRK